MDAPIAATFVAGPTHTYTVTSSYAGNPTYEITLTNDSHGTTLDVGSTRHFTYTYLVTQAEINNNGTVVVSGGDQQKDPLDSIITVNPGSGLPGANDDGGNGIQGFIDNSVTAFTGNSAAQAGLGISADPNTQFTQAPVEWEPAINIEKLVSVDGGLNWYLPDQRDHVDATGATIDDIAYLDSLGLGFDTQVTPDHAHPNLHAGAPPTVLEGTHISYEVVITNTGNITATGISVVDSGDPSGLVFAPAADLAPGASEIVAATSTVTATGGSHTDTATVSDQQGSGDHDTASYSAVHFDWTLSKTLTVDPSADGTTGPVETAGDQGTALGTDMTTTNQTVNLVDKAGQEIHYTVTLHNDATGPGAANLVDIKVWDSLLGGYLPIGTDGTTTVNGVSVTLTGDANGTTLDVGDTWTWTYTHAVSQGELNSNGTNDSLQLDPLTTVPNSIPTTNLGYNNPGLNDDGTSPATGKQGYIDNTVTAAIVGSSPTDLLEQLGLGSQNPNSHDTQAPVEWEPAVNIEKLVSIDYGTPGHTMVSTADWYLPDDSDNHGTGNPTDDILFLESVVPALNHSNLHAGTPPEVVAGDQVSWLAVVTNIGNIDLTHVLVSNNVTDTITAGATPALGENIASLAVGATAPLDGPVQTTAVAGGAVNTVKVTFDQGVSDQDTAAYNAAAQGQIGLTKGYWGGGNKLALWDDKGTTGDLDPFNGAVPAPHTYTENQNWNQSTGLNNSGELTSGSSTGMINAKDNGGGDFGLLLGDLNHSGTLVSESSTDLVNNGQHQIFFDLESAQGLLTSSVTTDARIILGSQAIAAQLNDYNQNGGAIGSGEEPNGLIEAAVRWLTTSGDAKLSGALTGGNVDYNNTTNFNSTTNDVAVTSPSGIGTVATVIDHGSALDYTQSSAGVFQSFTQVISGHTVNPAISSSSDAWQAYINEWGTTAGASGTGATTALHTAGTGYWDAYGHSGVSVAADGEGLKNALAAFNNGLASGGTLTGNPGYIGVSTDGKLAFWHDNHTGTITDVVDNMQAGSFWVLLHDYNMGLHFFGLIPGIH